MTKDEVKAMCEDDDKLQWWAMVLFAEICAAELQTGNDLELLGRVAQQKVKEFPRLVIQRQIEKAKQKEEGSKNHEVK